MNWSDLSAAIGLTLGIAYLAAMVAGRLAWRVVSMALGPDVRQARLPAIRRPIWIVRTVVFLLTAIGVIFPALDAIGLQVAGTIRADVFFSWLMQSGLRIVLIALGAFVITRIAGLMIQRFEHEVNQVTGLDMMERAKRARTLGNLIHGTVLVLVILVAGLMILRELRIDIMPVLTGAGIAGLAVGFGAQTLVRDIIAGFFLILENQVRVGDVAVINGTGGLVEQISLRTIVLRDEHGSVHIFPNGAITALTNRTRDFSYAVVNVGVAYREDTDVVVRVLEAVGVELAADPAMKPSILAPLEILGVEALGDSQVTMKIRIKTVPLRQAEVGRELRRRIKKAFDARGIEIPFPHVTVYYGAPRRPQEEPAASEQVADAPGPLQ